MANKRLQLKKNYALYTEQFDNLKYINSSCLSNRSFPSDKKLYRIGDESTYCPHSSSDGNNGGSGIGDNQNIFRCSSNSPITMQRSVKYNRNWGCYFGNYNVPNDDSHYAWLHGVKGIHFDWELSADTKFWCKPQDMWLTFASRRLNDKKIWYAPLVQGGSLKSGVTRKYSGHDFSGTTQSIWDGTGQGKFSGEWCGFMRTSDISWVESNKAVLVGAWFNFHQERRSEANKTFTFKLKWFVPMMNRDDLPDKNNANSSKNYRVLLPAATYKFYDTMTWSKLVDL